MEKARVEKIFETVYARIKEKGLGDSELCINYAKRLSEFNDRRTADDWAELAIGFLTENIQWLFIKEFVNKKDLLSWFTEQERIKLGFFIDANDLKIHSGKGIIIDSQVNVFGHSHFCVFGESSKVTAFDSSYITVFQGEVIAKDCFVFAFNNSKVSMKGYGKVEAFDIALVVATGYSTVFISDESSCSANSNVNLVKL